MRYHPALEQSTKKYKPTIINGIAMNNNKKLVIIPLSTISIFIMISTISSFYAILSPILLIVMLPIFIIVMSYVFCSYITATVFALNKSSEIAINITIVLLIVYCSSGIYLQITQLTGDLIHLTIMKSRYDKIVLASKSKIQRFDWGGTGMNPIDLIHATEKDMDGLMADWPKSIPYELGRTEFATCTFSASALYDDYHVIRFSC